MSENLSTNNPEFEERSATDFFNPEPSHIEEKIAHLREADTELSEIRNFVIDKKIKQIENEGFSTLFKAALPSFILLLLSFFIDIAYVPFIGKIANQFAAMLFPGTEVLNQGVEPIQFWWLPLVTYLIFLFCAFLSNNSLKKEIALRGVSEGSISRIIDRYSGIVDAIGTALPLLGAAILLVSIKEGPTIFLGFSVPFEVKSIVVLAMAKLFDSVFSSQALKYQEIAVEISKIEEEYYFEKEETTRLATLNELKELRESGSMGNGGKVNTIPQITREQLEEIRSVVKSTSEVNDQFAKNIANLNSTVSQLNKANILDPQLMSNFDKIGESLNKVTDVIQRSTEYSEKLQTNMSSVKTIVSEINNINLPDEKVLKELQITAHFLSETMNNMKDSTATKSLENLVYLAGKR